MNWTCTKCNSSNAENQRFCGSCGQPRPEASAQNSAPELPPTMLAGYVPQKPAPPLNAPSSSNQFQPPSEPIYQRQNPQNYQQSQHNYQSNQQNHHQSQQIPNNQAQYSPAQSFPAMNQSQSAPKKSRFAPLLIIGGIVGFVVVLVVGIVVYVAAIKPYLAEQAFIKQEKNYQTRADTLTLTNLLPSSFTSNESGSPTYQRTRTFTRTELLQASEKLPEQLKSGINDVTDGTAAEYNNSSNSSLKVVTQIFKFNSPDKAFAKCNQIGQEMQKRSQLFKEVRYNPNSYDSKRPSLCYAGSEGKTGEGVYVRSAYGILYVTTGGNYNAVDAAATSTRNLFYSF